MDQGGRLIPYQPLDLADPADLVAAIRQRRGGQLINLDRMLLHSTPLARGWNQFLGEVRSNLALPAQLKELAMCGVAVLNRADYEFLHHSPLYIQEGGSVAQVDAIKNLGSKPMPQGLFTSLQADVLDLIVQMTQAIEVDRVLMKRLQGALGNTQLVELVGVIAAYNMVSRFLVALEVTPDSH